MKKQSFLRLAPSFDTEYISPQVQPGHHVMQTKEEVTIKFDYKTITKVLEID